MKDLNSMKLLHVSDLHFNQVQFEWVTEQARHYDLLCMSGDLLDGSWLQSFSCDEQVKWIKQWASSLQLPTFICSGNHDQLLLQNDTEASAHWLKALKSQWVSVDNDIVEIGGHSFGCIPYDSSGFYRFRDCDVLLHHVPPSKLKVAKQGQENWGCSNIRTAIEFGEIQAKYLLCGHVHLPQVRFSKFKKMIISNPGNDLRGEIPNFNVITLNRLGEK